jgi:hypothetical protein
MADITPTAALVLPVATGVNPTKRREVVWGATIVQGKTVYRDNTDNKWKLADNNVSQLVAGQYGAGIALTAGSDGQIGEVAVGGDIDLGGATMALGESYYVSPNVGMIAPVADILTTQWVTQLGVAISATRLRMPTSGPNVSGVQHV